MPLLLYLCVIYKHTVSLFKPRMRIEMSTTKKLIGHFFFMGRWLQLPLYFGLLIILAAYVYRYVFELFDLVININGFDDTHIMLGVLDLIDVVMIANLLIM